MISGIIAYYILATIGITLGYHRYLSHGAFKTNKILEVVMLTCGILCGGRSALTWAATHRMHHMYADTEKDPYGTGWTALLSLWKVKSIPRKFVKDLIKNPRVMWFHKYGLYVLGFFFLLFPLQIIIVCALSWIGFGVLNRFGHKDGKPVNRWWLNLIAPWEGQHEEHHHLSKRT